MIVGLARWWKARSRAPRRGASSSRFPRPSLPPIPDERLRVARKATLERLRGPLREDDQVLALEARLWLLRLPAALQPGELTRDHPRVANRLARAWHDPAQVDAVFDDLLRDHRGDRRGFARGVASELRRLRHFSQRQRQHRESRRPAQDVLPGDTQPMALLDDPNGIDWTPTETIVVRDDR